MNTKVYITFFVDPIDSASLLILAKKSGAYYLMSPEELSRMNRAIVTHDSWMLVDSLCSLNLPPPKNVIEINLLDRYCCGYPQDEIRCVEGVPWDTSNILRSFSSSRFVERWKSLFWAKRSDGGIDNPISVMKELLYFMELYFENKLGDMSAEQIENFFSIEVPIHNIFSWRQYRGIKINEENLDVYLRSLDDEYYRALSELKDKYGFKGEPFGSSYIVKYIENNGIDSIFSLQESTIDQYIRYNKNFDIRVNLLNSLRRLKITKNVILKASHSSTDRISPIYNSFGSVTGRIQVVEPALQHMKKEYRGIFRADEDMKLFYIDYSQFEPSILAYESGDERLKYMINQGDVYKFLAENFLEETVIRDDAKNLFMQFLYGAKVSSMSKYLSRKANISLEKAAALLDQLILELKGVSEWRERVISKAREDKVVFGGKSTIRRFRVDSIESDKVKRKLVNHKIQASGALLLKYVILDLYQQLPEVEVLIPMYDALLVQGPSDSRKAVEELFVNRFTNCYPGVACRIKTTKFDGTTLL